MCDVSSSRLWLIITFRISFGDKCESENEDVRLARCTFILFDLYPLVTISNYRIRSRPDHMTLRLRGYGSDEGLGRPPLSPNLRTEVDPAPNEQGVIISTPARTVVYGHEAVEVELSTKTCELDSAEEGRQNFSRETSRVVNCERTSCGKEGHDVRSPQKFGVGDEPEELFRKEHPVKPEIGHRKIVRSHRRFFWVQSFCFACRRTRRFGNTLLVQYFGRFFLRILM